MHSTLVSLKLYMYVKISTQIGLLDSVYCMMVEGASRFFSSSELLLQVLKGADVVQNIEKAKTNKDDMPYEKISIVNIEVKASVE